MAFYATNSCGKETKADEVLLLYEMSMRDCFCCCYMQSDLQQMGMSNAHAT